MIIDTNRPKKFWNVNNFLLIYAFSFPLSAFAQTDIRIVGGRQVDLAPIHEYESGSSKAKAERPLAHWKKLTFETVEPSMGHFRSYLVTIEGGGRKKILLNNPPQAIIKNFLALEKATTDLKNLADYIEAETKRVRFLQDNAPAQAPTGTYGANQIRQANLAAGALDGKRDDYEKLSRKVESLRATCATGQTEYAMFSGQKFNGLEIWDCGAKKP